jgi:LPS-assembly lipoprotein
MKKQFIVLHFLKKALYTCIISLLLCGLTACGFQLRGHYSAAQPFKTIYLQMDSPYGPLESKLRQTLQASSVRLVDNPAQAPLTLHLYTASTTNTNVMIGPSSQSRSYTLTYTLTYVLLDAKRSISLPPEKLQASRTLILSPNQLPQSNNQTAVLNREMERDIISQLYNRLYSAEVQEVFLARP